MSDFTTAIVTKPKFFGITPKRTGFGTRERYVIGFDTEAVRGRPISLQFAHPDGRCDLIETTARDALSDFLSYLGEECTIKSHSREYIVFGFNLRYEYTQLFRNIDPECFMQSHFVLHHHEVGDCTSGHKEDDEWTMRLAVMNDKRYSFTIKIGPKRRRSTIKVIDAMAFFSGSLASAATMVGMEKHEHPRDWTNRSARSLLDDPTFVAYAKQDALITQRIGEVIVGYHRDNDVPVAMSAPMFAAYVFKRRFLDRPIPLPDADLEGAGLASYHGGKNGIYVDRPSHFDDAWDYDVNGAYSSAMASLPDLTTSIWEEVHTYEPSTHALWYVRGRMDACVHRSFQHTSGEWYTWRDNGDIATWITGYELDAALACAEFDLIDCSGFVLRGESGTGSLARYVAEFYDLKRNATSPQERTMAKLALNSLYGKFIQKVPTAGESVFPLFEVEEDEDGKYHVRDGSMVPGGYRAGGLYHPPIASLITGYVRAAVHRYEHKYRALMTSTDGFLSLTPPDDTDIGDDLGKLKVVHGSLSLWREKVYDFRRDDGGSSYALHGFRGGIDLLRTIPLEPSVFRYTATKVIGLGDSLRRHDGRRYEPGVFIDSAFALDLRDISHRSPQLPS